MKIIAVNTLHDSAISIFDLTTLHNFELERLTGERYLDLFSRPDLADILAHAMDVLRGLDLDNSFDLCVHHGEAKDQGAVEEVINAERHQMTRRHHHAHAAAALYASPFQEALIISFDGGGYDGVFNVYTARRGGDLRLEAREPYNLGTPYRCFAYPISEIGKRELPDVASSLDLDVDLGASGKLMGLAAYGSSRPQWKLAMKGLMSRFGQDELIRDPAVLLDRAGLPSRCNELSGQDSFDFAATAQAAFEELFFETAGSYLVGNSLPVCLTGGAALNVLLNEQVRATSQREVFVPPNPNDCGVTAGVILDVIRPEESIDLAYSGWPLLDRPATLPGAPTTPVEIARLLAQGNIIGVARGNSEHGPRALGNRSILCDPGVAGMKDRLNERVKFREWFRPYAPVTRLESVGRYFEIDQPAPYMSFAPAVRQEWKARLPAIVHEDGTARVQTVTERQNRWLYQVLEEFQRATGYDVLLNTSFNIKGRPILTTVAEALEILRTTSLDFAVIEGNLVASDL